MTAIIKKELRTYFNSIMGYVFIGFVVLIAAIYFYLINIKGLSPEFYVVLQNITVIFLILVPAITMRLIADEVRQKTDQLLLTSPISVFKIVVGKFIAAAVLFLTATVITVIFPLVASPFGAMPVAQIVGSYLGFYLVGLCFISVGLFISSLTENQVVAAVATFAALFLLFILNSIASGLPSSRTASITFLVVFAILLAGLVYYLIRNVYISVFVYVLLMAAMVIAYLINNNVFDGVMVKSLGWLSIMDRYSNFGMGILNLSDIVYYISFSAVFVYLTVTTVEKRRWS